MKNATKAKTFTAYLLALLLIALIIFQFFVNINPAEACYRRKRPCRPPLGKTLIKYFVYPDGTPIGKCLEVELWDGGNEPIAYGHTDADGKVVFSGLLDGTYTLEWTWQGVDDSETVRINCSKLVWKFTNEVPYWVVEKTFTYLDGTPIEGLYVTMNGWSGYTDSSGTVSFSKVKAGTYTISWSWQGVADSEDVTITFDTPSPVKLANELPSWTLEKTFIYEDGTPIEGLDVYLDSKKATTDASGKVTFSCLKVCVEYTISWSWQGVSCSEKVHIKDFDEPSPIKLTNNCPYWTVEKTFYYDTIPPHPISHLNVTLDGKKGTTNENGTVVFTGLKAGTYTIEWVWGNETKTETVIIGFQTASPVVLTNYLEPKSGGGINLHLAEE